MNSGDIVDVMRARIAMAGQPLMMPTETCAVIVNRIEELETELREAEGTIWSLVKTINSLGDALCKRKVDD